MITLLQRARSNLGTALEGCSQALCMRSLPLFTMFGGCLCALPTENVSAIDSDSGRERALFRRCGTGFV
jgi:hypothetical protein